MTSPLEKKIVFLYTELAQYFMACIAELKKSDWEIHVFHWPVNPAAPFKFLFPDGISFYPKTEYSLPDIRSKIEKIDPSIIVVSGWIDKDYLKLTRRWKPNKIVIMGLDNHWKGSFKQRLLVLFSKFYLQRSITHIWVPGTPQKEYAQKLGFGVNNILMDLYSADVKQFNAYFNKFRSAKETNLPKRFLFVGRYTKNKGIFDLWNAFIQMQEENPSDWELICIGTGEEYENRAIHPKINHVGFVQPLEIDQYVEKSSVFVLPSLFEPWGLVVHEFAAAGFLLLISDCVGAVERFVETDTNGFIYKAGDVNSIKNSLFEITQMSDSEIFNMGCKSTEFANRLNPAKWAVQLEDLL